MAGLKLGKNVLQVYGSDRGLITALASVIGLSGQACAVAETRSDANAFESTAAKAGVLVEVKVAQLTALPYDDDYFDLVVIKQVLGELTQKRPGAVSTTGPTGAQGGRPLSRGRRSDAGRSRCDLFTPGAGSQICRCRWRAAGPQTRRVSRCPSPCGTRRSEICRGHEGRAGWRGFVDPVLARHRDVWVASQEHTVSKREHTERARFVAARAGSP